MTQPSPHAESPSRLLLTNDRGLGSLSVDMQSFFEFSFWMAEELEQLVAIHQQRRDRARHKNSTR